MMHTYIGYIMYTLHFIFILFDPFGEENAF